MPDPHSFHIPVMGLGFTIDTPLKVARFGISSVISIVEDELVEEMRAHHSRTHAREFVPIPSTDPDHRAKRITAYLNLLNDLVRRQTEQLRNEPFTAGNDIVKYFELLPDHSPLRRLYNEMKGQKEARARMFIQKQLREQIVAGAIDVNIMTKCDRANYDKDGAALPPEYSDALAALRGFANSDLSSSIIFSAGLNPRLYSYCASFRDFYPDAGGELKKKIIIKVSDFRSASVQGKFLAKKGLWVSEFRIESGLNCGGHAFATQGMLMGPILDEFRQKRHALSRELYETCQKYWKENHLPSLNELAEIRVSAQGGIGTARENSFLLDHFQLSSTGWGSPFLLVPEATNVDVETRTALSVAKKSDYYTSDASPLGVPFNNFRPSSSMAQRMQRIEKKRPGSPCYKKFLAFSTEFGPEPICTASRAYQHQKIQQIRSTETNADTRNAQIEAVMEKECLCEGLGASARLVNEIKSPHKLTAVAICPGPNLAYFSGEFSLRQMVDHIYGRTNILNRLPRPHMFLTELNMYIDFLRKEIKKPAAVSGRKPEYFEEFRTNLLSGIAYYQQMFNNARKEAFDQLSQMIREELRSMEAVISGIAVGQSA